MVLTLFETQQRYINAFFHQIDLEKTNLLIDLFYTCQGAIIFTGVGKSGIIANKLAMTMLSTGTKAYFLSPINALHGDIGIVTEKDIFVFLSKTGETQELMDLLPYARKKGARIVSLTSNPKSRLAQKADLFVHLPMEKELCPYNLAPTTSTAIQLIFGDIVAVALMQKKNFSRVEFAKNHPGGMLGKKITLQVKDLMLTGDAIPFCHSHQKIMDLLPTLSHKKCGALIVIDREETLEGIFTDGDLRRAIEKEADLFLHNPVCHYMSSHPKTVSPECLAWDALQLMEQNPQKLITLLPVVEGKKVIGVIRMHDILQAGLSGS
ncbi:MAG: KpsF/GutQ family sugar-phosphate isomerase [Parachlamydiales bacterium]|nr:KpsF/GutQ family sugar-phosphate isomerase [Parachlamydiales bacterium]